MATAALPINSLPITANSTTTALETTHDVAHLEARVRDLHQTMARLAQDQDLQELLFLIRRPGWTTPAELALVSGLVDMLHAQARSITQMKEVLMTGSRMVGGH